MDIELLEKVKLLRMGVIQVVKAQQVDPAALEKQLKLINDTIAVIAERVGGSGR